MRKILGTVLLGLGGFLVTTALLLWFWVPGQVKQTPLNVNSTTRLDGTGSYLGSASGPLKASSRTVVDGPKSKDGVVVFETFTCLLRDPQGNAPDCVSADGSDSALINAGTDTFATDRHTALSVDAKKYVGADALQHSGLVNKFPFDAQKKTYPFWDSILGRAVDAKYSGVQSLDGLSTYTYLIKVENQPAEISDGVSGTYSDEKAMWVDPKTGSIIKQSEHQVRTLDSGGSALDMNIAFTNATVAANVKDAKANGSKLSAVKILPLPLLIIGLLGVVGGVALRRGAAETPEPTGESPHGIDLRKSPA